MSDEARPNDDASQTAEPSGQEAPSGAAPAEQDAKASGKDAKASGKDAKASGKDAKASGKDAKASHVDGEKETEPRSAVLREPELPAAGTPDGDTLRRGLMLYRVGNYREMRAVLTPLASAKDPAVADAASALLRRIAVDPVQIGFLVGCLLAIVAIALHYLGD